MSLTSVPAYPHCNNMKIPLVQIGNSRGIRIPKPLIEECRLSDEVEIEVKGQSLVISPVQSVREGWDEAFQEMNQSGDDRLLDEPLTNDWEDAEWEWM